jgi:hypothetical protein
LWQIFHGWLKNPRDPFALHRQQGHKQGFAAGVEHGLQYAEDLRIHARFLAGEFDRAPRLGTDIDEPEGARTISISDTLAHKISRELRELAR